MRRSFIHTPRTTACGSTLIELIIYVAIVAVLLVGVGTIGLSSLEAKTKTRAASEVLSGGTLAIATITRLVAHAEAIVSPAPGLSSDTLILASGTSTPFSVSSFSAVDGVLLLAEQGDSLFVTPREVRIEDITFFGIGEGATSTGIAVTLRVSARTEGVFRAFQHEEIFTTSVLSEYYR